MLTYDFLQHYSWIVVSALAAIYVFLQFVYSAGAMIFTLGSDERQRSIILKAIGIKWRFAVVSIILFMIFAFIAFPGFQTAKGQGNDTWIFFVSMIAAHSISCELLMRNPKPWLKTICKIIVVFLGWLNPFLLGFIGSSFYTGVESIELLNFNYGFLYLAAAQTSALLYLYCVIHDEELSHRIIHSLKITAPILILLIITTIGFLFYRKGIEYDANGYFRIVELKYLQNFVEMPHALAVCIAGVSLTILGIIIAFFHSIQDAFWCYIIGVIVSVQSLFLIVGFNNTAVFPCYSNPQLSLTLANSAAPYSTLLILDILSVILLPLLLYILIRVWRKVDFNK